MKDQLWTCRPGRAFADLVAETKTLCHREDGEDGEEGGAFFEGFGEDATTATRDYAVDSPEYFGYLGGERVVSWQFDARGI